MYEFDISLLSGEVRENSVRWLTHFNGRIGYPAQNVQLGWRSITLPHTNTMAQVSVGSFGPPHAGANPGLNAVVMLDSVQFFDLGSPTGPFRHASDFHRLAEDEARWREREVTICGEKATATVADISGCHLGHAVRDGDSVAFVCRDLDVDTLQIRRLPDRDAGYRLDPTRAHTVGELEEEWQHFFLDRPDLGRLHLPT